MGYGLKVIASQYYDKETTTWYSQPNACQSIPWDEHNVAYDEKNNRVFICKDGTEHPSYELWNGYMSFNQSVHRNIWYVPRDFNHETVGKVIESLDSAISKTEGKNTTENVITNTYATGEENFIGLLKDLRTELLELPLDAICLNDYS